MAHKTLTLALLLLSTFTYAAHAQRPRNPALRKELLNRVKKDQRVRADLPADTAKITRALVKRLESVDKANTAWLKRVVQKHGWPGKSLVGSDGAQAAWLLVQHADLDPEFQKQCLELMEKAVQVGEALAQNFVYLTDRVRSKEGKLQLYGTLLKFAEGRYVPFPIEDEANVDKRRAAVGLPTLAEYLKFANQ